MLKIVWKILSFIDEIQQLSNLLSDAPNERVKVCTILSLTNWGKILTF